MDLQTILGWLKDASPWAVLGGTILAALWIILTHREKIREQSFDEQQAKAVEGLKAAVISQGNVLTGMVATQTQLLQEQGKLTVSIEQLCQQLVTLNAMRDGQFVGVENTRMIILYQWNWCRDETWRILQMSIDRNHIAGRETVVAGQVARAWRKAAQEARTSLDQLKGMSADYTGLFSSKTLTTIWDVIWRRALPIYFKDFPPGSGTEEDHRSELQELVKSLFDNAYDEFIACQYEEHVQTGSTSREKSNPAIPINAEDMRLAENMVNGMRMYTPGSKIYPAVKAGTKDDADRVAVRKQVGLSVQRARTSPPDSKG